jgi:uncharacterized membrane protein
MNRLSNLVTGLGLGAGMTYFFDPILGKRRRSLLFDQFNHVMHQAADGLDCTIRDMRNRAFGTFAEVRGSLSFAEEVSDAVLRDRVRAKMGRYISHPSAIEVAVHDGVVTLGGPILAKEVDRLLCATESVRGVHGIENRLDVHESAENVSALQGGRHRRGEPRELSQEYWSPTTRVAIGGLGSMLMLNCAIRRTPASFLVGTGGFFMFLRALTNLESKRMLGLRGRRGIDVQKTIVIDQPVEDVFEFLSDPSNYPRFTDLVTSVNELGDGRYQKTIAGPAGAELTVTEKIVRYEPNQFIAVRSEPDSALQYAGRAWFEPLGGARTRVHIQATYNPPGGVISHSAARFAGLDLKSVLDDTMMRAKSFLETGVQPGDSAQPPREPRDARQVERVGVTFRQ